jgi:hypothetical protein
VPELFFIKLLKFNYPSVKQACNSPPLGSAPIMREFQLCVFTE